MNEKLQKYIENKKYELALQLIHKIQKKNYSLEYHNYKIVVYLLSQKFDAAIHELTALLSKYPNDPSLLCNMGLAFKGKKNFTEATNFLNKSLRFDPENLNIYLNLIELYIECFDYTKAIALLKEILQKNSRIERCYQLLAFCYREINSFEESHKNLEFSIQLNPFNYETFYHLGFSYIWKKDFARATECFRKCNELNKKYLPAIYQLNKLNEYKLNSDVFYQLEAINDKDLDLYNLSFKYLTLSEIFYNHHDYRNFFKHLHLANQYHNKLVNFKPYNHRNIQDEYNKLPNFEYDNNDITPIFIIGMPRSGSSLIEQVLSQSEDVYAAGEIPILHEIFNNYLNAKNISLNFEHLTSIKNTYLNFINLLPKKKFIIDKLPLNFFWIGFIKKIFPKAIFIHSVRNKLDIYMSLYRTFFAEGVLAFSYSQINIVNFFSSYYEMINFWKSHDFELIDVHYEDIINSPDSEFTKLFDQLKIKYNKSFLKLEDINRPVKTASFLQINNKLAKISYPDWSQFDREIPTFLQE